MLQNPSHRRHHSKWVLPFLEVKLCAVVGLTGNLKPVVSSEANGGSEWQVSTHQPHGRSRCWSPGLSHLTTYGADGECWSLTWIDLPWCGQIYTKKPQNIFICSPLAHRSWNGVVMCLSIFHISHQQAKHTPPLLSYIVWRPLVHLFYSQIYVYFHSHSSD